MKINFGKIAVLLFLGLTFCTTKHQNPIHVAVNGDDGNDGSAEHPLLTLKAAQAKARVARKEDKTANIDVVIHEGTYYLDETLKFGLEDSSEGESTITYRAAKGEVPVISGGHKITNWKKLEVYPAHLPEVAKGNVWVADLAWLNETTRFHSLILGDEFLPRASSKGIKVFNTGEKSYTKGYLGDFKFRKGFEYTTDKVKIDSIHEAKLKGQKKHPHQIEYTFYHGADVFRQWENLSDIELYTQPTRNWLVNYLTIDKIDTDKKYVSVNRPATYSISTNPVFIENAIDFLDTPGNWCINTKTQKLYYWPKADKPEEGIVATRLDEVISVEGESDASLAGNEKPVRGLVFRGLTITHADRQRWEKEDAGLQHDWDMWDKANGLIRFKSAEDCRVTQCDLINSASDGVRMDLYCQNISIDNSRIENLGGVGIVMAGYGPGLKDVNHHNKITNNTITKPGQILLHSPAVFIWQSGYNEITNNHVYDLAYTGMVFAGVRRRFFHRLFPEGKKNPFKRFNMPAEAMEHIPTIRWDEIKLEHGITDWESYHKYMHTRGNVIAYNEIHDCMKKLMDGNAIYMSAHGKDNQINYNVVYNHLRGGSIRTDDDSHDCVLKGNTVFATISPLAIRIKGKNKAYNNHLINGYFTTGFAGNACDENSEFKYNVLYHTVSDNAGFHKKLNMVVGPNFDENTYFHTDENVLKEKKATDKKDNNPNQDQHSIYQDPQFVAIDAGDLSLKGSSPSIKLGTESLPSDFFKKVGPTYDPFMNRFIKNKEQLLYPKTLEVE